MGMVEMDTGTEHLRARLEDGVLVLLLNRPHRRNALSQEMLAALESSLEHAETSPEVRCVLLSGEGGAFCAGGDVKAMAGEGRQAGDSGRRTLDERIHLQRLSQRRTAGKLFTMPKPTLAVIPGAAAGAGLSLALACDLRLASSRALLTTAFAKVGFSGDFGGSYFLTQLVGAAKARELYYLSDRVDAQEALRLGLVNWVAPEDELWVRAMEIGRRLASGPSIAYRYMKENLNRALAGGSLDDCLDLEATHHVHSGFTEDHRNAARAFVEKREPVFKGR